jgi:predicted NUDIX family NTP pyrophosphohydrolase
VISAAHSKRTERPVVGKLSAGVLMFRRRVGKTEVLLVHPGGRLWAKKDKGAWSIPKGEVRPGEDLLRAAKREFEEEIGFSPRGDFVALGTVKQKGGKLVQAWGVEGDCDTSSITSNTFALEWPPCSRRDDGIGPPASGSHQAKKRRIIFGGS